MHSESNWAGRCSCWKIHAANNLTPGSWSDGARQSSATPAICDLPSESREYQHISHGVAPGLSVLALLGLPCANLTLMKYEHLPFAKIYRGNVN